MHISAIVATRGDYIASIDSDVTIGPEMLATLHATAVEGNLDVACCGARVLDERRIWSTTSWSSNACGRQ